MNKSGNSILLIWKNFLAGDKEAFAHLYNLHVDAMYRYGTKLSADGDVIKDAIHEIFLDLFLNRHNNKTNPENLRLYLILALKRNIIRKLKKSRRLVGEEEFDGHFELEYSIENVILKNDAEEELNSLLDNALKTLPTRQKEALYLRYNLSMEYKDIAQVLNISVESVRKQVYRALSSVRDKFNTKGRK